MTYTDMEQALENIDRRMSRVEQILPTLATKQDLERFATKEDLRGFATKEDLRGFATKEDLRGFATKEDLRGFATKEDLRGFATKEDLRGFATKEDLRQGIAEAKHHTDVLIESVRDDIRIVAEGVVALVANLRSLTERLEEKGVI